MSYNSNIKTGVHFEFTIDMFAVANFICRPPVSCRIHVKRHYPRVIKTLNVGQWKRQKPKNWNLLLRYFCQSADPNHSFELRSADFKKAILMGR